MSISRDEAREIAVIGLLAAATLRVGAGVFQLIEELGGQWTFRSLLSRLFAPIGSTVGMLTLAAVLLVVLSPSGSISTGLVRITRRAVAAVAIIGMAATFHTLALSYSDFLAKIWFAMINGLATTTLAGTGWWIMRNFDQDR
ncbi:MAG: hypothetical protein AAGA65_25435 [Actinomycetota bacterium]